MGSMPEKPRHGFGSLVTGLQEVCESGITKDLAWRRSQLKGIIRLLTEKEEEMFDVLHDDLGKHRAESYRDEVRTCLFQFESLKLVLSSGHFMKLFVSVVFRLALSSSPSITRCETWRDGRRPRRQALDTSHFCKIFSQAADFPKFSISE
jgi:hypothetical protein